MSETNRSDQRVVVVDVNMKFGSMVLLLVKFAVACIPAAIILAFIGLVISLVFGAAIGSLGRH